MGELFILREILLDEHAVFIHLNTVRIGEHPDASADAGRMLSDVHAGAHLKDGGAAL